MGCNKERGTVRADERKKIARLYKFELKDIPRVRNKRA